MIKTSKFRKNKLKFDDSIEISSTQMVLENEVGRGSYGSVFRGICRGKDVAIKKIKESDSISKTEMENFKKEIKFMMNLRHPNIVLLMGACTEKNNLCIVTELLERGDLHTLIYKEKNKLTTYQKLNMIKDIALGINWLHSSNPPIVHRDIKPRNLLIDENFRIKICDFGLSITTQKRNAKNKMAYGTPRYMSPEVMTGERVTEKADVYSFGCVIWELFNEAEPFSEIEDVTKIIEAVSMANLRPKLNPNHHPSINKLISDCWEQDPYLRPDFNKILYRIENVIIDAILVDPTACDLWKKKWKGKREVEFKRFYSLFCRKLGIKLYPNYTESLDYLCFFSLLSVNKDKKHVVTLEKFGNFINWFGPLKRKDDAEFDVFADMKKIMKQDWFFGDISREFAEMLLSSINKKKGSYLIRLTMTDSASYPFTISKVKSDREITHLKIHKSRRDNSLYIKIQRNGQSIKVKENNLLSLIEKLKETIGLKYECVGRKYNELFYKAPAGSKDLSRSCETD